MLRIPYFLDNRLTDSCWVYKLMRLTRRLEASYHRKFLELISVRSWVSRRTIMWLQALGQLKDNDLVGNRSVAGNCSDCNIAEPLLLRFCGVWEICDSAREVSQKQTLQYSVQTTDNNIQYETSNIIHYTSGGTEIRTSTSGYVARKYAHQTISACSNGRYAKGNYEKRILNH
jgi:hypothetical protein